MDTQSKLFFKYTFIGNALIGLIVGVTMLASILSNGEALQREQWESEVIFLECHSIYCRLPAGKTDNLKKFQNSNANPNVGR